MRSGLFFFCLQKEAKQCCDTTKLNCTHYFLWCHSFGVSWRRTSKDHDSGAPPLEELDFNEINLVISISH